MSGDAANLPLFAHLVGVLFVEFVLYFVAILLVEFIGGDLHQIRECGLTPSNFDSST